MKCFTFERLVGIVVVLTALAVTIRAQQPAAPTVAPRGIALEVTYFKGRILAYQRIGEWSWYELFQRPADWKPRPGEVPVAAVKISTRVEDGVIKAKVTVLRGINHETEDFVAHYTLVPEKTTVIRELSDLGVEPFEMQLVRAPSAVADPPAVVNKTKSLQVSVEPRQSTIPMFLARVLNNSAKPVANFSYYTSVDGARKLIGSPRNDAGGALIKPGDAFERTLRHHMKVSPVSTGEVPPALSNLIFNVTSVVFTDGTYEGDAFAAAGYLAGNAGEKAQLRSFLEMIGSREFTNSPGELEAAIASVNVDSVTAEFAQKFPTLTAEEKAQLRGVVDFGKSRGVKLFRNVSGEPVATLAERLQKRIDALP